LADLCRDLDALGQEIRKVVVGQDDVIDGILIAVAAGGHVLIEGVPGLGKTLLAETLADTLQLSFQRIQFTPDLMPADLLGTHVVMENAQGRRTFEFQKGPLFSHLILADHINRGLPKTQSALLEAMESGEVTVSNESFELPQPFLLLATQNPMDMEGAFPLPEPELDRFLLKLRSVPPSEEELERILERTTEGELFQARKVLDGRRILEMREIIRKVPVDAGARRLAVALCSASQPDSPRAPEMVRRFVRYGASPRGAQALVRGAKVLAVMAGRPAAAVEDINAVAHPALRHRLLLNYEGQAEGIEPDRLIDALLAAVGADTPAAQSSSP
jgi:MoxR-like ATPase